MLPFQKYLVLRFIPNVIETLVKLLQGMICIYLIALKYIFDCFQSTSSTENKCEELLVLPLFWFIAVLGVLIQAKTGLDLLH